MTETTVGTAASKATKAPIFTIIAGVFLLISLGTPMLLVTMPVMGAAGLALVAMLRKERPRWLAPIIAICAVLLVFAAGSHMSELSGDSEANLSSAKITQWSWDVDSDFGTDGTIKWRAEIQNTSDRPIRNVKVDFTTYDRSGKLLTSTFAYVSAIPPGGTKSDESFADLYGTEDKAQAVISEVHFADD